MWKKIQKILLIDSQSKSQSQSDELSVEEIIQTKRDEKHNLPVKTDVNDLVSYVMTSGSTGQPKVILRTNENQLALTQCLQHKECYPMNTSVTQLANGFCHISGQMLLMACINGGAKVAVIRDEIDTDLVFKMIIRYDITSVFLIPPRLNYLAKNCQKYDQEYFSCLKDILTGGAPISETTHKIISKEFESVRFRNCKFYLLFYQIISK